MSLMYYSSNGEAITFTYPDNGRGEELKANLTAENNHWKPNTFAYPDNMTVMAVVELNGEELGNDNYELAVFANGECRGSVKLTYADPLHRHVAFLTISGKDATDLNFRLYNTETEVEYYDAEESLSFSADAIVGDANDLFVIHFRAEVGTDEFASKVQVYPNPTSGEITLEGDGLNHVRIVNTYGQMVYNAKVEGEQVRIDLSNMAKGIYMMHIEADGGQAVRKIVIE